MGKRKKVNVVTMGCSKNLVDSEYLMARLSAAGYDIAFDSAEQNSDVVIINTCGFIGDAKEESIEIILAFGAAKTRGEIGQLFVMGCLSQRYREELREELPEVDEFFGVTDIDAIVAALSSESSGDMKYHRYLTTPPHYAYLKISEGCNWGCGYCAIPLIRGRHVSVPMEDLLREAELLAAKGVKELMVIAQDTTYYGMDIYGERRLAGLLRKLCAIDGVEWVRLHYAYPAQFPTDVIEAIRDEPKMCKYIDIPFQHISDNQLKSMRRGIDRQGTCDLINKLRAEIPGIAIRTTLLTGYPGETEADFAELEAFVREVKFERLGVFPYSEEEGTYSAKQLRDDVPQEIKDERADRIMAIQQDISLANNQRRVGSVEKVIIDRREGEYFAGRTQYDSPEVDQEVLIASSGPLTIGEFYTVKITSAEDYDLFGSCDDIQGTVRNFV